MCYRTIIAIGLILVLFSPVLWVGSWFYTERNAVRREARNHLLLNLDDGDLEVLTFSEQTAAQVLHWEKDDEFEFQGRMYDVVRWSRLGAFVHYWVWPDEPESKLNKTLRDLTARLFNDAPEPGAQSTKLFLFLKSLFFKKIPAWTFLSERSAQKRGMPSTNCYNAPVILPPHSPPQLHQLAFILNSIALG